MQREVDSVRRNAPEKADLRVDIARGDDHAAGSAERARIEHRRHAETEHRHAERPLLQGGAGVAHAGAGHDARVRELERAAQPLRGSGRKGVDGQHAGRAHMAHGPAHELEALHARCGQHAGRNGADRPHAAELLRQVADEVARQEQPAQAQRPEGIRRDGFVSEPGHEHTLPSASAAGRTSRISGGSSSVT